MISEIGSVLQHHTSETLEKRLNNLLRRVCQEDYFKSYEYNSKKLVLACNHLVGKYPEFRGTDTRRQQVQHLV